MSEFAAVAEAKDYDEALAAFESIDAEPSNRSAADETRETPKASSAVVESQAQPAEQQNVQPIDQAKADYEALLERAVPATDEFPRLFHGQPMRKLVASIQEQDRYITKTRDELTQKNNELIAAQATARVLLQQEAQRRGGQPAAASRTTPPTNEFFDRHGMADPFTEFTRDPTTFFARVAEMATTDALEKLQGQLEPLAKTVGEDQINRQVTVARNAVERAFDQICQDDKITDPTVRKAARDRFDRIFGSKSGALAKHVIGSGEYGDHNTPDSWVRAYREEEQAVGGFMPLMSVAAVGTLPTGVRGNPPSSARAGAGSVGQGAQRVGARQSKAVHSLLADSGFSDEDKQKYASMIDDEIATHLSTGYIQK